MYLAYRWISRDLGRAEVIFSIIIISIILGTFINKSLQLFALAERHLVEASVSNIQTALRLQTAIQSIGNNAGEIEISEGMNPVMLMQSVPDDYEQYIGSSLVYVRAKQFAVIPLTNYLGEMFDPEIESLARGNWYFDKNSNVLVYLVEHTEIFGDNAGGSTELRYKVHLDYTDINNNQHYDSGEDILKSVSLVNIELNE